MVAEKQRQFCFLNTFTYKLKSTNNTMIITTIFNSSIICSRIVEKEILNIKGEIKHTLQN